MRSIPLLLIALLLTLTAAARGQAAPAMHADPDFAAKVNLVPLRTLAVQQAQTVKTFDTFARQTLDSITGHTAYNGQDPVYTVLDMAYRPEAYVGADMILIRNVPLRTEFNRLSILTDAEKDRIVKTGLVSLALLGEPEVQQVLKSAQSADVRKMQAIGQFYDAVQTMNALCGSMMSGHAFPPVAIVPPARPSDVLWHRVSDLNGDDPDAVEAAKRMGRPPPEALPGYTATAAHATVNASQALLQAWRAQDPQLASNAAGTLALAVAEVDPAAYPSPMKRQVEVTYNHLAKMTLPGAACYFVAFVLFLTASRSGIASLRIWGIGVLALGILVHTTGIAVRWWLVGSIPIKNEFESVMFSAWFVGLIQAMFRGLARLVGVKMSAGTPIRNLFGAAAGFVGWLSLLAIFTVPLVTDTSIGSEIGMANGVLYSYWLYIHVTMVTASYALIGMGFCLSVWWLVKYYSNYGRMSRLSPRQLEGEAQGFDVVYSGATAAIAPSFSLRRVLFRLLSPIAAPATASAERATRSARAARADAVDPTVSALSALDACNLVVLQLAFWALGLGIVFGAIWADMSWGRPWGWDPKETFALITWIVYLIVVHVRVATEHKAWWTAVLSAGGFFVMLFNWIGVNFFLHGLHSYAG
jgi:cytochrome c-type biogenesis protein CcsB